MPDQQVLHLIVPGICGPLAETDTLQDNGVLNKWITMLAKSHKSDSKKSYFDVLKMILKLENEINFPSASLSLMADGAYDSEMFHLHADPVHLEADMDHAILTSAEDLDISNQETNELITTLNEHFEQDGLVFSTRSNQQWFVSANTTIELNTTSLKDATGRNINFLLPTGKDSTRWKQLLTEAQMLMFAHEVNVTRENSRQLSINSLWFHGAGNVADFKKANAENNVDSICSDQKMLKGLAGFLNINYSPVPTTANAYAEYLLANKDKSVNVLHLTDLEHLVNYSDVSLWLEQLSVCLENWIYPLLTMASRNNIRVILYPCNENQYLFSKHDGLRFWRRGKLEQHVVSY